MQNDRGSILPEQSGRITTNVDYLRDLANRLMQVPVMYGVDQGDANLLYAIATQLSGCPVAIRHIDEI